MEARKARLAAKAELNATLAAERITNELQSNKHIPLNVLVPVFGVSADKPLALRGDVSLTIRHDHFLRVGDDDLYAFAARRAEEAVKAKVIAETHQLAGEKRVAKRKANGAKRP